MIFQSSGDSASRRSYSANAWSRRPSLTSFSACLSVSPRSNPTGSPAPDRGPSPDGIKEGRRPERAPVRPRVAKPRDGLEMIRGGVPLVTIEPETRVRRVQRVHQPISMHLRDDGRGGDRGTSTIALDDAPLRQRQV